MEVTRRSLLDFALRGGAAACGLTAARRMMLLDLLAEDAADPAPFQIARVEYAAEKGRMLSRLGFGMMRLPMKGKDIDEELSGKLVDYAYRHGVNYFDTAWFYIGGKSQYYTGKVLEKYDRKSLFIVNKLPGNPGCRSLEKAKETFATQLKACRTDYFDNYLCHAIGNWGAFKRGYLGLGIIDYLKSERDKGRIRHLGFSFHGGKDDLRHFLDLKDQIGWEFVMLQLNADDWKGDGRTFYEMVVEAGLPVMVMEPLHGGRLAKVNVGARKKLEELKPGLSPAGWAFRFVTSLKNVTVALSGMSSMSDVIDNINTFRDWKPFTDEETKSYFDICAKYQGKNLIPCTGCEYCIPCPHSVKIPEIFGLVNMMRIEGKLGPDGDGRGMSAADRKQFLVMYKNKLGTHADASCCTSCGNCLEKCPQHVKIVEELQKVVELVDRVKKGGRG